jgi:hypothetical protein
VGWANAYIGRLLQGQTTKMRPRGNSMHPRIKSGELVTIEPLENLDTPLRKGDMVLCQVRGSQYVHIISAIRVKMDVTQYQISNNHGKTNGWTSKVFGKVVKVEP